MWHELPIHVLVGLRHESDGPSALLRHLLDAVLVDDVVVGHGNGVAVPEIQLLLARPRLALGRFDAHTGRLALLRTERMNGSS